MAPRALLLAGLALALSAGARAGVPVLKIEQFAPARPWTGKPVLNDPRDFQFAIVTDRTGGHRPGVFGDAVRRLNLLRPQFVMSVGDLIEGYTEDVAEIDRQWDEFEGLVDGLAARFFYVPGNHDISNPVMGTVWDRRYGPRRYHFTYGGVLFLCLDSQDPPTHHVGDAQVEWLRGVLARHPDPRWTMVFTHTPLWNHEGENGWGKVEALLKDRPHTVFAGHEHAYRKDVRHDRRYFTLATTGGVSQLRGRTFGEFDHVVWVTMTDAGPIVANLLLQGVLDENLTEDVGGILRRLAATRQVTIAPVVVKDPGERQLTAKVRLANDEDVPMGIRLSWKPHGQLKPKPRSRAMTIPPNGVRTLRWPLRSGSRIAVDEHGPATLEYRVTYGYPGLDPVEMDGSAAFGYDVRHVCRRMPAAPAVDGDLAEWGKLPYDIRNPKELGMVAGTWKGERDGRFAFGVGHDDDFLYVAVRAWDDRRTGADRPFWQSDAVVVFLDRYEPEGPADAETIKARQVVYGQTPEGQMPDYYESSLPKGSSWACVRAPGGYQAELAVPRAAFAHDPFRLNVWLIDTDGDEEWGTTLCWRPGWGEGDDHKDSGVFRIE